jgi:transmembrane sensor
MGPCFSFPGSLSGKYMEQQRLLYLLQQYGNDAATPGELDELQHFLASGEDRALFEETMAGMINTVKEPVVDHSAFEQLSQKVLEIDKPGHRMYVPLMRTAWFRYAAAAVLVLAVGVAGWFWIAHQQTDAVAVNPGKLPDTTIAPGKNGAVLTLADGKQLVLDSLGNGVLATQGGTQVALSYGKLVYDTSDSPLTAHHSLTYNIMSTPKGRQFQLVLPDGSRVWLNAASSIKYPTAFTGRERLVELDGEAYFEVAKDKTKPFRVQFSSPTGEPVPTGREGREGAVEVLGTHFNINAYHNEAAITTTLIEGMVRVKANTDAQVIRPGEQAQVVPGKKIKIDEHANVNQVLAWKNGYFDFNNADLRIMMRQLERWYNIQVAYEGPVPEVVFKGKMDRFVQLSDLVRFLTIFGINARLEERTLIIRGS